MTVPERTTPIQYTLKPLYSLLPTGPKRTALKIVIAAYVNSAGKYPSVDNRASAGFGSLSEEAPPPSPIFNNILRPAVAAAEGRAGTLGSGGTTHTAPGLSASQAQASASTPATQPAPLPLGQ